MYPATLSDVRPRIDVLIVDDEPLARRALRRLIRKQPDLEIVGECGDAASALASIRHESPDLVFLDIQMPGMSGLDLLCEVGEAEMPLVVFTTAYDGYAVQAFEEGAIDYVLKPFDEERFLRSLQRVRGRLERSASSDVGGATPSPEQLVPLLERLVRPQNYRDRFLVRVGQRMQVVNVDDIDWIEASNNQVALHVGGAMHMLRETMSTIAGMLDPQRFIRVHRSAIVNVSRVQSLQAWNYNEFVLQLADGTKVFTGRTYREQIRKAFGH